MDFAALLEKIKTLEGGDEMVAAATAHTKSLRDEAERYRTRAQTAEGKLGRVAEKLGTTADADLEAAVEAVRKPGKAGGNDETSARITRLEQELEGEKKRREEAEGSARTSKAKSALLDALTKNKALRPEDFAEMHLGRAKFREDGSPYFVDGTGAERSVEEFVGAWLKDRPELIQSTQQRGPGGPGAPTHGKKPDAGLDPVSKLEQAFSA